MSLQEVREAFSQSFPHLKLEFFKEPHKNFTGSHADNMIRDVKLTAGHLEQHPHTATLVFEADTPTFKVEQSFEETFGLHVQVFRRSGKAWLETSRTDALTLAEQNDRGASSLREETEEEMPDYRDQD